MRNYSSKQTSLANPIVTNNNRIRCAMGEPGDVRVPTVEELFEILNRRTGKFEEVDVDISEF